MAHASLRFPRSRSTRALLTAVLVLGVFHLAQAQQTKGPDKPTSKTPAVAKVPVTGPMSLKMTIVSKDPDVQEMAKFINEKIEASWKANNITPAHYADDYEFIRRASLDIIGRIATPSEIRVYMKDAPDRRRSLLVERLLKDPDYPRHWANLWSNWLLTRAGDFGRGKYHDQTTRWLQNEFALNKPYNETVTKLITASGKNTENGAVNFVLAHVGEPIPASKRREEGNFEVVPLTSRITRVFLGTQVQCAQCHPHPFFGSLKQEQFWGINAFLRQIQRDPPRLMARNVRPDLTLSDDASLNSEANVFYEMRNGKVRMWHAEFMPASGKDRGPRLDAAKTGIARREELARMVVEHDMFPKALVNRMWGLFYGRGFVNPIDDFNDNNQPSNPELLNEVAVRFKHYNYDLKKLIRWIAHSNAYHLSYVANRTNDKQEHESQFARMVMKSMTPEQLFESLNTATLPEKLTAKDEKEKEKLREARERWLAQLITNFGDDEGNEITFNGTIVQALMMMNGQNLNDAISSPTGTVANIVKTRKTHKDVIDELYLTALNRLPKKGEMADIQQKMSLRKGFKDSPKAAYEDLFWALLNTNEFLLNH